MFQYLEELNRSYCYYFQYTLNGYDTDIEPNVEKLDSKIKTLKELSMKTSKHVFLVFWIYMIKFKRICKTLMGNA